MPPVKSSFDSYRKQYQEIYGKTIRHDQWLQVCREIREAGLRIDHQTIKAYARFKKANPRKPLTKAAIEQLETFTRTYAPFPTISGREISTFIQQKRPYLRDYAIYKSFYKAGLSFKADQLYKFDQAYQVLTFALTTRSLRRASNV